MAYLLYKLKFPNGLHISANNSLESTSISVHSDTFYSALYSEYIKLYGDNKLFEITKNGNFLISDLFPFKEKKSETNFYLPKPFVNIARKKVNDLEKDEKTVDRKKVKRLNFIPASKLKEYFSFLENGENFPEIDDDFG
ncbi:MAG: type III-A CRISPR-associated RAMP protein Csm4, partial [Fusobacterium sp.]|nr:type III-A CRISPR-associated RAMP protein Csm4 [Fusobacterium sp.]